MRYLFLFGRTPLLSRAELLRLVEVGIIKGTVNREFHDGIILDTESLAPEVFARLGGTIRVVELSDKADRVPEAFTGKFNFGFSYFHVPEWQQRRRSENLSYKKKLMAGGIGARFVDASEPTLPTAAVIGNRLIDKGSEFVVYRIGSEELLGRTLFIQDIDSYSARDQARPARDAKVGMLPLKLAQSMINLAAAAETRSVWDPMVGTGVVLQESLLMGYEAYGSDNSEGMVEASSENVQWLREQSQGLPKDKVFQRDITLGWPSELGDVDAIVTEGYLGKRRHALPGHDEFKALSNELFTIYKGFFAEAAKHLVSGSRIVICFPFFEAEEVLRVNFIDELASDQYTLHGIYDYRPHEQIVGRQVTVFEKV